MALGAWLLLFSAQTLNATIAQSVGSIQQTASESELVATSVAQRVGGVRQRASVAIVTPLVVVAKQRLSRVRQCALVTVPAPSPPAAQETIKQRIGTIRQCAFSNS